MKYKQFADFIRVILSHNYTNFKHYTTKVLYNEIKIISIIIDKILFRFLGKYAA